MTVRNVVLSLAIAGTAGAILGVLFAPTKGSVVRRWIGQKGAHVAEKRMPRPTTRPDGAANGFDAFKDSALDWADMGEMTVFSRSIMDRTW